MSELGPLITTISNQAPLVLFGFAIDSTRESEDSEKGRSPFFPVRWNTEGCTAGPSLRVCLPSYDARRVQYCR